MKPRRPPRQRCPRCGGDHYNWHPNVLCARCKREDRYGSQSELTLGGLVREQRLARRREAGIPETVAEPFEWGGELNDIPY